MTTRAFGTSCRATGAARRCSGRSRIFASTRSNGARLIDVRRAQAVRVHDSDQRAHAIEPRIVARHRNRARIDVDGENRHAENLGGGDRKHARAGADIEDTPGPLTAARQRIQCQQAAAGGAVMTCAECGGRLDFEADAMARHPRAVVRAVHDEAAGRDRPKPDQAFLDPVARRDLLHDERACQLVAAGERDHRAQAAELGTVAKMQIDLPAFVRPLEGRAHHLGRIETLGQEIGDTARRAFAGNETGNESGAALVLDLSLLVTAVYARGGRELPQELSTGYTQAYRQLAPAIWPPLFPALPTGRLHGFCR